MGFGILKKILRGLLWAVGGLIGLAVVFSLVLYLILPEAEMVRYYQQPSDRFYQDGNDWHPDLRPYRRDGVLHVANVRGASRLNKTIWLGLYTSQSPRIPAERHLKRQRPVHRAPL